MTRGGTDGTGAVLTTSAPLDFVLLLRPPRRSSIFLFLPVSPSIPVAPPPPVFSHASTTPSCTSPAVHDRTPRHFLPSSLLPSPSFTPRSHRYPPHLRVLRPSSAQDAPPAPLRSPLPSTSSAARRSFPFPPLRLAPPLPFLPTLRRRQDRARQHLDSTSSRSLAASHSLDRHRRLLPAPTRSLLRNRVASGERQGEGAGVEEGVVC